ncbi:MAG: ECF-type sigma factor [Acidobacteriota bacterium]
MTTRGEITELLVGWSEGDHASREALMARIYGELQRLAASFLNRERGRVTLDTVGLVTEAYLRLVDQRRVDWRNRAHFFAIAGRIMRRIVVDRARRQRALRHGHGREHLALPDAGPLAVSSDPELVALDEALEALERRDPEQARVVELRFFGGLARREIATVLGLSSATVARRWRTARVWLLHYLSAGRGLEDVDGGAR